MAEQMAGFVPERETLVINAFVDLSDSLIDDYDPLDFLYRLLDHSLPLTRAVAGAVLLHYEGSLHLVASSDEKAEAVGILTVETKEGPAYEAFELGEPVTVANRDDLAARWPRFAAHASSNDWSAAFATPLRLRDRILGALVVFWTDEEVEHPTPQDQKELSAFANVTSIAILQQRETSDVRTVNLHLHKALESRIKVEQAKGIIAATNSVPMGEAFDALRRYARFHGVRVADVCRGLIAGELHVSVLNDVVAKMPQRPAQRHTKAE